MSSDKKSDDFVVRIPGDRSDSFQEEKDPFLARTPSHAHRAVTAPGLHDQFAKVQNNPSVSIMAYCLSSISMTVVNKYCVSGKNWNLNLFYLAVQVRNRTAFSGAARRGRVLTGWCSLSCASPPS